MEMKRIHTFLFLVLVFLGSSCKTEFEKLRMEGSVEERLAKANEYLANEECYKAQVLFESIIGNYRGRPEQEKIYFDYAKSHYCQGNYIYSSSYFKNFSSTYPNSDLREEADYMVGYSYYKMSPTFRLDQSYTTKAIDEFQLFINTHPNSERVADCNRLIDECRKKMESKIFDEGRLYYDLKQYQSATFSFENLLKDFPESPNAEEVRYLIAQASYKWAENSILEKQEERYLATVKSTKDFLRKHGESRYKSEISKIKADSEAKLKEIKNE